MVQDLVDVGIWIKEISAVAGCQILHRGRGMLGYQGTDQGPNDPRYADGKHVRRHVDIMSSNSLFLNKGGKRQKKERETSNNQSICNAQRDSWGSLVSSATAIHS